MKDYKSVLVFLIPYSILCGSLYHIAFWSTFDFNGLSYIDTSNIIKSAIVPFITFFLLFFISKFATEFFLNSEKILPSGGGRNTEIGKKLNSSIGIKLNILIWGFLVFYLYFNNNINTWYPWAAITGIAPFIFINRNDFFTELIPNRNFRKTIIWLIVNIPIFSFASGKYESQLIYKNIEYKYSITTKKSQLESNNQIDTLKFISKTEKEIYYTDLNNSIIYILQIDKIDTISLHQKY